MPSREALNYYINWVLYAVLGNMQAADQILKEHRQGIQSWATFLRKEYPFKIKTLYRGLLLEPEQVKEKTIAQDPRVQFVSFSEDFDVACWFAAPDSVMSGYVKQTRPRVEGWIMEYRPRASDVLFHHHWGYIAYDRGGGPFELFPSAARMHPDVDERQFMWNLETQKEVITKPLRKNTPVEAYKLAGCPPTSELDERFVAPFFRGRF